MPRKNYYLPCTIEGCTRPLVAHGLCRTHYMRQRRHGTTEIKVPTLAEKFWAHIDKEGPIHPVFGQCWKWTAGTFQYGYGCISYNRRSVKTHRVSWELHFGPIPEGLMVLHKCDNPNCSRPEHLFLGTNVENQFDKVAKGRQARGRAAGSTKLSEDKVRAIRQRHKRGSVIDGTNALAREFGVTPRTILDIVIRKIWKHVA